MVLGIAGVSALGGVTVLSPSEARFCGAVCSEPLGVDAPDFRVCFDPAERGWTVAWKWRDGEGPECLTNTVAQYTVPSAARREYDAELDAWIAQGWLVPYDEDRHGAVKGLVPSDSVRAVLRFGPRRLTPLKLASGTHSCLTTGVVLGRRYLMPRRLWGHPHLYLTGRVSEWGTGCGCADVGHAAQTCHAAGR